MKIYTSNAHGGHLAEVKRLGLGIMLASSPHWQPDKSHKDVSCALDNGAFQCWRKGYPFSVQAPIFRECLQRAFLVGIRLDFVVCPDIVAGGLASLEFSMGWARGELRGAPRLALAVQDGMRPQDLVNADAISYFSHIFVGGTPKWKWATAEQWVHWAHDHGMQCHIGQCGRLHFLRRAAAIGADSVDSASIVRNNSWHIVEEFLNPTQLELSTDRPAEGEGKE